MLKSNTIFFLVYIWYKSITVKESVWWQLHDKYKYTCITSVLSKAIEAVLF